MTAMRVVRAAEVSLALRGQEAATGTARTLPSELADLPHEAGLPAQFQCEPRRSQCIGYQVGCGPRPCHGDVEEPTLLSKGVRIPQERWQHEVHKRVILNSGRETIGSVREINHDDEVGFAALCPVPGAGVDVQSFPAWAERQGMLASAIAGKHQHRGPPSGRLPQDFRQRHLHARLGVVTPDDGYALVVGTGRRQQRPLRLLRVSLHEVR